VRNDAPILALNIGSSSLKFGISPLQHIPDLALQVKAWRDRRRYHSFADGIVNQFVHCFVARDLTRQVEIGERFRLQRRRDWQSG
jgi:hypothetical protein